MNGATQAPAPGTLPGVTGYRLEFKGADWPDPAVPEDALEEPEGHDPNGPAPWSGDLYEQDDASDPVEAFAAFTGEEGVTSWLDVGPDGTLTGWVRDGEELYRYTDPEAWALDVDGAAMQRAGELGTDDEAVDGEPPAEGEESVDGEDDLEVAADAPTEPPADLEVDDSTGHDPNGDTPKIPGDGVQPENDDAAAEEDDESMDPRDDQFFTRKKKLEGKSLAIMVRPL